MQTSLDNLDEITPTTLRPGLLVSLHSEIKGNVNYRKEDIEADHIVTETGERRAVWQTERTVVDPIEHENATKVRGKANTLIRGCCTKSKFGLLCPMDRRPELNDRIREAREIVREFNRSSLLSQIGLYVVIGVVAQDDAEAVRAINSEISGLLLTMERGVASLDVKAIRDAATTARQIGQMLSPVAQGELDEAIKTARRVASRIVEMGEGAALEIDQQAIRALTQARTSFLDLDEPAPAPEAPEAMPAATAELDLDYEPPPYDQIDSDGMNETAARASGKLPELELDDPSDEPPAFLRKEWAYKQPTLDLDD